MLPLLLLRWVDMPADVSVHSWIPDIPFLTHFLGAAGKEIVELTR